MSALLHGCASDTAFHSFCFDLTKRQEEVAVLDYRYGNTRLPLRPTEAQLKAGMTFRYECGGGEMLRGDFLYVKWLDKKTGILHEETVDLRHRLPKDIDGDEVTFDIVDGRLFVYLALFNTPIPIGEAPNGPAKYSHLKVLTLYPDPAH